LRDTPEEYRRDIAEADQWLQNALETKRAKAQRFTAVGMGSAPGRIQIGEAVQQQMLIRRVDPVYPPLAQQARIQGVVRLNVLISREGTVVNVTVVSGHPLLTAAAIDAVRQWVYRPTLLNGTPVEVLTTASVPFNLDPVLTLK
jgi:TonB family protein